MYRYREPKHVFGDTFVRTVLDALNARHITIAKASSYLDSLKIKDLHQLEDLYAGFDVSSSMIYAWDNYPINQFPGIWEWMTTQVEEQTLVMLNIAFEEVANKTPECGKWLERKQYYAT